MPKDNNTIVFNSFDAIIDELTNSVNFYKKGLLENITRAPELPIQVGNEIWQIGDFNLKYNAQLLRLAM